MNIFTRLSQYVWRSPIDPRAPSIPTQLPHFIGEGWTPSEREIAEARDRHAKWRDAASTKWQLVSDPNDMEYIRLSIVSASTRSSASRGSALLRMVRILALDPAAQFFERQLEVLPDLRLVEFRHPLLTAPVGTAPIGIRFIRVLPDHWRDRDFIGLHLDGSMEPFVEAFKVQFNQAAYTKSLVEHFVTFAFDHLRFGGRQFYVVRDSDDFILPDAKPELDRDLTAQFKLSQQLNLEYTPDKKVDILDSVQPGIARLLIPPTVIGDVAPPKVARVFATVIVELKLFHIGLKVYPDGRISVSEDNYLQRTPKGRSLALTPIRSFNEQSAALRVAFARLSSGGAKT